MKPSSSIALAVLAGALAVGGCAAKAHDAAVAGYDFATFDSYAWITPEPVLIKLGDSQPTVRTGENELRIRAAVDDALAARGFTEVPYAEADVHVAFSVGTVVRYRLEGGRDSWVAGLEPAEPKTKGTLHVYLLHPGDEKEVWHGWTSKWLEKSDDPDIVIREAVAKVMAQYPTAAR
jgi:uncharacterized protein DUF4136